MSTPNLSANAFQILHASEYLSAFSLALTVWDHAITLDSEALYIWSASGLPFVAKAAYISNRYIMDAMFGFTAYFLTGTNPVSTLSCSIFLWIFIIVNCVVIAVTQTVVAWEIFNLWERKRIIATLLVVGSMIYIPVLFVVAVECVRGDLKLLFVPPRSTFCGFANSTSPWPKIAYGLIVASDLVVILLVILNAMARPRKTNHDLVFALHRDGAAMYTAVLVIRILALAIALVYGTSTSFMMLLPITAISAMANSRLMIRIAKLRDVRSLDSPSASI